MGAKPCRFSDLNIIKKNLFETPIVMGTFPKK